MTILEFILNNNDYLEDLITRSTYHSNAIEGSTLTYAETYAILLYDKIFFILSQKKLFCWYYYKFYCKKFLLFFTEQKIKYLFIGTLSTHIFD